MADDLGQNVDQAWDLIPAYALDAVDDLERRAVERLVEAESDARRELDEYREVVAAFTVDELPPAELRAHVLAQIDTPQRSSVPEPKSPGPARHRWLTLGVAAAVVAAVAVPTTIAIQARQEQHQMQTQADAVAQMLADPTARILTAPMAGGGEVRALVASEKVMLAASGMGDPGQDADYQLWVIDGDSITSAGLLHPEGGKATALLEVAEGATLAVTVEPAGGSQQPTTEPLVTVQI
jgi:anti-sigma-K factor RskA